MPQCNKQYFMTLAQYVRLPVIAWNADNSGFEQGGGGSLHLQLAPSLKHQARAIITLLDRYGWHTFSVITGTIAGHRNFDQVQCTCMLYTQWERTALPSKFEKKCCYFTLFLCCGAVLVC